MAEKIFYADGSATTITLGDTKFSTYDTLIGSSVTDNVLSGTADQTFVPKISLAEGNDTFTWQGQTNYTSIDGGAGTDTFVLQNATTLDLKTIPAVTNFEVLQGSTVIDSITGMTDGTQFATVNLLAGNDTFTWMGEAANYKVIDGGADNDTLVLGVATTVDLTVATTVARNFETLQGSSFADVITGGTDGNQFATVNLMAGNDTFTWKGETTYKTVDGGLGNDTFVLATAATLDLTAAATNTTFKNFETLVGSAYNDVVTGKTDGTSFASVDLQDGNDTFTWNSSDFGYTSINGGAGTDTFVAAGTGANLDLTKATGITNFEVFQGSATDDKVTGKTDGTQFATVNLMAGNDTFTWMGDAASYKLIDGGVGNDTFVLGVAATVDLTVATSVARNFETLQGSSFADVVTGGTADGTIFATVDLREGNDTFTWKGETTYKTVDGGLGNDTFVFATAATLDLTAAATNTTFKNFETLVGSAYNDVVTGKTDGTSFASVDLQAGNDTFTWNSSDFGYTSINGGAGTDTFVAAGTGANLDLTKVTGITNFEVFQGSAANDSITGKTDGTQFATVNLMAGNDTFTWMGEAANYKLIDGGVGTDTLVLGAATTIDLGLAISSGVVANFEILNGSSYADSIIGKTDGTQFTTVDLKAGNDTFTWMGETSYLSVDGSTGNDTFVLGGTSGTTLDLTSGFATGFANFETITGSGSADVLTGWTDGTQFATVNLMGGNDTFTYMGETSYKSVDGGLGNDTFVLGATVATTVDLSSASYAAFKNFETFTGSTWAETVTGKTDGTQFATVNLGGGNDTFTWMGESYKSIDGGAGTDTIIMKTAGTIDLGAVLTGGVVANFETFQASTGNDVVTGKTDGTQFTTIKLDNGNDTFTWMGETTYASIDGGAGTDTFVFGKATTVDLTTSYGTNFVNFENLVGSNSADAVTGGTLFTTINLMDGNDTFTWSASQSNFTSIDGGLGIDTLKLTGAATVGTTIDLSSGYGTTFVNFETLSGSTSQDKITYASSYSTVDLTSGGADVLTFKTTSWGTSTKTVDYGSQYTTTSELDFLGLNITGHGTNSNQFTFDLGTTTAYIGTATKTGSNLTIDFGTSGLGSIVLNNAANTNWTNTGLSIHSGAGNATTMYWDGSIWK